MKDQNQRKHQRIEINQVITVNDLINGGDFGELVNATVEGIMLITESEIPVNSIYQLALNLPFELQGSDKIILGADCLWCREVEKIQRFWSGFQIIDASEVAAAQMAELIDHYSR